MDESARTVLIVDDDPQILRLVERMLRPQSFKILVAPRPRQSLEICEREPLDLLISDVAMPEMDGNKLAEKVLTLRPETSIFLISGRYKQHPPSSPSRECKIPAEAVFPVRPNGRAPRTHTRFSRQL